LETFENPPLVSQKKCSAWASGVEVPKYLFEYFFYLGLLAKFRNPRTTPSVRKEKKKKETNAKLINEQAVFIFL
jgi:hypothetical protein